MESQSSHSSKHSPLIMHDNPTLIIIFSYVDFIHTLRPKICRISRYFNSSYKMCSGLKSAALEVWCATMFTNTLSRDDSLASQVLKYGDTYYDRGMCIEATFKTIMDLQNGFSLHPSSLQRPLLLIKRIYFHLRDEVGINDLPGPIDYQVASDVGLFLCPHFIVRFDESFRRFQPR